MAIPTFETPSGFSEIQAEAEALLTPCPYCGAGTTQIVPHWFWTGSRKSLISVEVKHWCEPRERQPQRALILAGSNLEQAINAWNSRVTPSSKSPETEIIVKAAIWFGGKVYSLAPPARHPDIVRHFGGFGGPTQYGFLTNDNMFVNRLEAMKIAVSAGQLLAPSDKPELYTEDLW